MILVKKPPYNQHIQIITEMVVSVFRNVTLKETKRSSQWLAWNSSSLPSTHPTTRRQSSGWLFCFITQLIYMHQPVWWPRSGSTLAQEISPCPTVPSHYLSQCGLIIKVLCGIQLGAVSQEMPVNFIHNICSEITFQNYYHISQGAMS